MRTLILILMFSHHLPVAAHKNHTHNSATATYLGNEAVMVTSGKTKIMFDPFFHQGFDHYQLVPHDILTALFNNKAPYDDISAIFISHAHDDHFAADQVLRYLLKFPNTKLIAPKQAIDQIRLLANHQTVMPQITAIELAYKDPVESLTLKNLDISVVRVPHSSWPTRRLDVSNLVYRVVLDGSTTVMHMGDADPNDIHFKPYDKHWQSKITDTAFPPYWFFYSTYGPEILENRINAIESVGVHVPIKVPAELIKTGKPYFFKPGETRALPIPNTQQ